MYFKHVKSVVQQMCNKNTPKNNRGYHGLDCMVVGFITTYAISAYHH